jgi:hypothetical protein
VKACSTCRTVKRAADFHRCATTKDGRHGVCIECRAKANRGWGKEQRQERRDAARNKWLIIAQQSNQDEGDGADV